MISESESEHVKDDLDETPSMKAGVRENTRAMQTKTLGNIAVAILPLAVNLSHAHLLVFTTRFYLIHPYLPDDDLIPCDQNAFLV